MKKIFDPATPTLDLLPSMELRLRMVGTDIYLRVRGLTMVGGVHWFEYS